MSCTHCDSCELFAQFALNPALQVWQAHYCQGEYQRCVRYQMSLRRETVPLNLLPNGTKVEIPRSNNDYSATALFNAILKLRVPMVESLLKHGIDVNVRNSDGMTPLMAAASTGNFDIVRMLLAKGADTYAMNNTGESAWDIATRSGHQNIATLLRASSTRTTAPRPAPATERGGWLSRLKRGQ